MTRNPLTSRAPPGLQGKPPRSSHGDSKISAGSLPPPSSRSSATDSARTPEAASTTVKANRAGVSEVVSGVGMRDSVIVKGSAKSKMSPASATMPGTTSTDCERERKLGVSKLPCVQGSAAAAGSRSQVVSTAAGTGTSVPGNAATSTLPSPGDKSRNTTRRCPIDGSTAIARGSTPTQQAPSRGLR